MKLSKLKLYQFKNYKQLEVNFNSKLICFAGQNGMGKTNLLDAIYYASIGKSYFNAIENQNILHDESLFRIDASYDVGDIVITYDKADKKHIYNDTVEYERLSDHLGFAPITFIAPDDNEIILAGSDVRRRFLNAFISQTNTTYLKDVMAYRKLLNQRNASLKANNASNILLSTYNEQMIPLAEMIHTVRQKVVEQLSENIASIYAEISEDREQIKCRYSSQLNKASYADLLQQSVEKDRLLQRTTTGIHKDDLVFTINGYPLKKYGSQGQQKTFLLSLKLAEYKLIEQMMGKAPILLLDDVFDKIDRHRAKRLFAYLKENCNGQIFMSDTNAERLFTILSELDKDFTIFMVENNELTDYARE